MIYEKWIEVRLPIRYNMNAIVCIPRDLTVHEASRIAASVKLLGIPHFPNRKLLKNPEVTEEGKDDD